jgi:hypothetical protein
MFLKKPIFQFCYYPRSSVFIPANERKRRGSGIAASRILKACCSCRTAGKTLQPADFFIGELGRPIELHVSFSAFFC